MTVQAPSLTPADADPALGPLLNLFHMCVCEVLAEAGRPVCQGACCLAVGDSAPPADQCACECPDGGMGQAWVRWVEDTPVRAPGGGKGRSCTPLRTRTVIEAGVYRCVAGPGADGGPPSCAERERDAWGLVRDRRALKKAVSCCPALKGRQVELVKLEPTAVKGGCAGVLIQFSVEV